MAWNDEAPDQNGGALHSSGAHSKGLIAYNALTDQGVYIAHSIRNQLQIIYLFIYL